LHKLLPPYVGAPTAEEIANADAIAAAFGIESSDKFRKMVAAIERSFVFHALEGCWAGVDSERNVLIRTARGPREAAAVLTAARRGELSWYNQQSLMRALGGVDYGGFGEPLTVEGAERMAAHVRAYLAHLPAKRRGRKHDFALAAFHLMYVHSAIVDFGVPWVRPARLVAGIWMALRFAVLRARQEAASCAERSAAAGIEQSLTKYYDLSDAAIRNRVRKLTHMGMTDRRHLPRLTLKAPAWVDVESLRRARANYTRRQRRLKQLGGGQS
jgi:hypothetical protein